MCEHAKYRAMFFASRSGVIAMKTSAACSVCDGEKKSSVVPDLLPVETKVDLALRSRPNLAFAKFGAYCRNILSSLPQFELSVFVAMLVLATAQ